MVQSKEALGWTVAGKKPTFSLCSNLALIGWSKPPFLTLRPIIELVGNWLSPADVWDRRLLFTSKNKEIDVIISK